MIKVNLLLTEYMMKKDSASEKGRLKAIHSIKRLLSQIDHKVEVVPENNKERLTRLLISLKGESLNQDEAGLIDEIINY